MVDVSSPAQLSLQNWTRTVFAACLIALITLLIFIAAAPRFTEIKAYQIAANDIIVFSHEGPGPFRHRRVNETVYDLTSVSKIPPHTRRQYTYTFTLDVMPALDGAVFIPAVGGKADVYLNGIWVGEAQASGKRFLGFTPLFFSETIPRTTYQTGLNRLVVVLTPDSSRAGLSNLYIGEAVDFSRTETQRRLNLNTLRKVLIFSGIAILCLTTFSLFGLRRKGSYLTLLVLGGGLTLLGILAHASTVPNPVIYFYSAVFIYVLMAGALVILARRLQIMNKPILCGLWIVAIASILLTLWLLLPIERPRYASSFLYFSVSGTLPFAAFLSMRFWVEDRKVDQTVQSELEAKISRQQDIIALQEAEIEEALKAKGRLEERQRLTRDIHDGIGGQLLSLLVRVRDGDMTQTEIEDDLQYGLNDLRLIVDSMDHSEGTLESAFVTFQARANVQLSAAGIRLNWSQSTPFSPTYFGPAAILNIYRLMQESVTNAIRHSKCDQIEIRISRHTVQDDLTVQVEDNGLGFDLAAQQASGQIVGQGLKNMQFRAKALGGTLSLKRGALGGTVVTLTVPPEPPNTELI